MMFEFEMTYLWELFYFLKKSASEVIKMFNMKEYNSTSTLVESEFQTL